MPENARKCVLLSDLGVFSPRGSIYMLINEVGPCLNIFSCRIRSKCWVFRLLGGGNGYNSWHWASFYRDRESILRYFKHFFGLKIIITCRSGCMEYRDRQVLQIMFKTYSRTYIKRWYVALVVEKSGDTCQCPLEKGQIHVNCHQGGHEKQMDPPQR